MIAFISESAIAFLKSLKEKVTIEILMDGTFKILPTHMKFSQLYIMSFIHEGRCYPFGYVFMEKRNSESYNCLFENLKELWGENVTCKVTKIMTDYEKAVRSSAKKHFPNARISGWVLLCYLIFIYYNYLQVTNWL